eukprot:1844438-Rhodomonas_salina.1
MTGDEKDLLVKFFFITKENDERNVWKEEKETEMYFTETDRIVLDLLSRKEQEVHGAQIRVGHMTVVRVCANDYGFLLREIVKTSRDSLFLSSGEQVENTFAVIQDTRNSTIAKGLEARFKEIPVQKSGSEELTRLVDILQDKRKTLTYTDLEGIPCLLFLCEKGRMGDTFPK